MQDSKSIGRYLLESLDRIIKEVREERSKAAPEQGELGDVPQERANVSADFGLARGTQQG